jgi:hypothetical protein
MLKEEEFYDHMMSLEGSEELIQDIENIIDDDDAKVSDENTPVKLRKKYREKINDLFAERSIQCDDLWVIVFTYPRV